MNDRHIPLIIATSLFAFVLWFSVSMSEEHQVYVNAPLDIHGLPRGMAVASPLPRTVRLSFHDQGWRLAKLLWRSDLKWVIDVTGLPHTRSLTLKDLAEQLSTHLGIQPTAMSPELLVLSLDSVVSKRIAVVPDYSLSLRDGYGQVGTVSITPESVTVTGAKSMLQKIDRWGTVHQDFEEIRQSIDAKVKLVDTTSAVVFTPAEIRLHMDVQQFAERTFEDVSVELLSVPQNREIVLSTPYITLVVRGGIEQLSGITQRNFRAVVEYKAILADTSGYIQPDIKLPNGLQVVQQIPDRVGYIVRKKL